jgi:hypothetical protein
VTAAAPSPLTELFQTNEMGGVGNDVSVRALFSGSQKIGGRCKNTNHDDDDIVESRLEALFKDTVAGGDTALDNASFLQKNPPINYDLMQQQVHLPSVTVTTGESKRQHTIYYGLSELNFYFKCYFLMPMCSLFA